MFWAFLGVLALGVQAKSEPADTITQGNAAGVPVRVIRVNLNDPKVTVAVQAARGLPHGVEAFHQLIGHTRAPIAVNGAYASKTDFKPIGDIVIKGRLVTSGLMGTAMAITKEKEVVFKRVTWGHAEDWSRYETVLACGPALVLNGKLDVLPEFERFSDPHVMNPARRIGVGVTPDNHLLLVNTLTAVSFRQFGQAMLALGCRDAMNLDAGASMGMYYRGKYYATPGRHITNALIVHTSGVQPDFSALMPSDAPAGGARRPALPPPADPGNSAAANAIECTLCADSMGRANAYCPQKIKRRLSPKRLPKPCPFHRVPMGE